MRGPKSRAGLIAYPVVGPKEKPTAKITSPTIIGPNPAATLLGPIAMIVITKTAVPSASPKKFEGVWRIAGAVENIPKIAPESLVSLKCG